MPDTAALLATAQHAAHIAGDVHRAGRRGHLQVASKAHAADLVTQVDVQAEAAIREVIQADWPGAALLGEESAWPAEELARLHERDCWVVDPLDGTQNYVTGLPLSCVSIAYIEQGQPLVGVVYDPQSGELYSAVRGHGATLNGQSLSVSGRERLDTPALLATGFSRDIAERPQLWQPFLHLTERGLPVRRLGCAALTLAYVAAGRLDGYWDNKLAPWDVAAGILLVEEAGGLVSNLQGQPYTWGGPMLATNGHIHKEWLLLPHDYS